MRNLLRDLITNSSHLREARPCGMRGCWAGSPTEGQARARGDPPARWSAPHNDTSGEGIGHGGGCARGVPRFEEAMSGARRSTGCSTSSTRCRRTSPTAPRAWERESAPRLLLRVRSRRRRRRRPPARSSASSVGAFDAASRSHSNERMCVPRGRLGATIVEILPHVQARARACWGAASSAGTRPCLDLHRDRLGVGARPVEVEHRAAHPLHADEVGRAVEAEAAEQRLERVLRRERLARRELGGGDEGGVLVVELEVRGVADPQVQVHVDEYLYLGIRDGGGAPRPEHRPRHRRRALGAQGALRRTRSRLNAPQNWPNCATTDLVGVRRLLGRAMLDRARGAR